jgi:putative ABC transport system permease protein
MTVLVVAAMCATILLTNGRVVGANDSVIASFDQQGTRTIVVRATPDSGLESSILNRLSTVSGIESTTAFGPAFDVENAFLPHSQRMPARVLYGTSHPELGWPDSLASGTALASTQASRAMGMGVLGAGGVTSTSTGESWPVVGLIAVPEQLKFLEPLVVTSVPGAAIQPGRVSVLVVVAQRPELLQGIAQAVRLLLGVQDPSSVTITTSEQLADLRSVVDNQLGIAGRGLLLTVFAVSSLLVAAILYTLVTLRRKDFGRRRALGAARSLVVVLLVVQVGLLAVAGSFIGSVAAAALLWVAHDPIPGLDYFVAVAVAGILCCLVAAVAPALIAASRDPLRELRVP